MDALKFNCIAQFCNGIFSGTLGSTEDIEKRMKKNQQLRGTNINCHFTLFQLVRTVGLPTRTTTSTCLPARTTCLPARTVGLPIRTTTCLSARTAGLGARASDLKCQMQKHMSSISLQNYRGASLLLPLVATESNE